MVRYKVVLAIVLLFAFAAAGAAERINHEGRILGPAPVVTNAVLFNTSQADAILSAMQVFPVTSAWNEDISDYPTLPNSDAMIAQIIADLSATRRSLRVFQEMNFVLVPDSQPSIPIAFMLYGDESDPSPYPIPSNMPIEGWPTQTGTNSLFQWQQDTNNTGGDRHSIIVQPGTGFIWETWQAKLRTNGAWQASNGARFDLNSNSLRPLGYTSGDAAGLPMFAALPRYDECSVRGVVEHAVRIVVARSRREYIYPATHFASTTPATQTNVPAMGQRLRLKSSFVIPPAWAKEEKALLTALKKYGAIVADNGNFFSISITPDNRWPANAWSHISSIGITNFEVIQTTGEMGGPRSAGAPSVFAGVDQVRPLGTSVNLQGAAICPSPAVLQWKLYSGPGTATFGNAAQTNTTVNFSAPGTYTLMLSVDDNVHPIGYDAMTVTVIQAITLNIARSGTNVTLTWTGGGPPYTLERSTGGLSAAWSPLLTTNGTSARLPISGNATCFRVRGQ